MFGLGVDAVSEGTETMILVLRASCYTITFFSSVSAAFAASSVHGP